MHKRGRCIYYGCHYPHWTDERNFMKTPIEYGFEIALQKANLQFLWKTYETNLLFINSSDFSTGK